MAPEATLAGTLVLALGLALALRKRRSIPLDKMGLYNELDRVGGLAFMGRERDVSARVEELKRALAKNYDDEDTWRTVERELPDLFVRAVAGCPTCG